MGVARAIVVAAVGSPPSMMHFAQRRLFREGAGCDDARGRLLSGVTPSMLHFPWRASVGDVRLPVRDVLIWIFGFCMGLLIAGFAGALLG